MHCPIPSFLQDKRLAQSDWDALLDVCQARIRPLRRGEFLVQPEDEIRAIYVVLSGTLDLTTTDYWGNSTLLGQVREGHLFGAAYAFGDCRGYLVAAQAYSDCRVLVIPVAALESSLTTHPALALPVYRGLLSALAQRSLQMINTLHQVKQHTLRNKVMAYLSYLAVEQHSNVVLCPLSRGAMADYLGVERASLCRELSAMQREGILTYHKNKFVLKVQ